MQKVCLLVAVAVLVLCCSSTCRADEEALESFQLDDASTGRTFITVNGSNIITTPNFVVGITLIGIALALLAGSAASAASVAAASTIAAGSPMPGKYKRSIPEDAAFNNLAGAANLLQALSSMEQQFKNFDVADVECRKRMICEIHQEGANAKRLGALTDIVLNVFNNLDASLAASDKYPFLKQYLEAANHGKGQRECSQLYNTCDYSIRKTLRNLGSLAF